MFLGMGLVLGTEKNFYLDFSAGDRRLRLKLRSGARISVVFGNSVQCRPRLFFGFEKMNNIIQ